MIKFLFISINTILLFILGLFSNADGISVSGSFPKTMQPGSEAVVEVKVTKGALGGFAKLQLELPEGFTVTEIENKSGTFSFASGIVKWVWPALPSESDVVVKFNLKADATMSGAKTVAGKFSYVENNAKQVVEMPVAEINITTDGGAVATENNSTPTNTSTPNPVETPTIASTPTVAATPTVPSTPETPTTSITQSTPTTVVTPTTSSLNDEPPGSVTVLRYIKAGNTPDEHIIEMKISKGSIKGFAKFTDDLPAGYTAKSVNTSESSFSVADGKVKFVWVTLPSQEEITISYILSGRSTSMVNLTGEFSYLANDQSKKFIMQLVTLPNTPSAEVVAVTTPTEVPTNTTVPTTTTTPEVTTTITPTTTPEVPTNTVSNTNPENTTATNITENRAGDINYRVQIGAFNNPSVTSQVLARKFGVRGNIISEMQGGLNKFMVGNHPEYRNAHDQRDQVKSSVTSAFVVAYNGAKRITVQEALMLTNQKWFK